MINQLSVSTKFDVTDARNWMNDICGQHDLIVKQQSKLNFQHEFARLANNSIALGYVQYGTDAAIVNEKKLHCYSISLPLSGEQELSIQNQRIHSNSSTGLILNPQEELMLDISGDCKKIHLAIPKEKVDQVLRDLIRQDLPHDIIFSAEMDMNTLHISQWWKQIHFYLDEISLFGIHSLQPMYQEIESLLIKKLLLLQKNNYSEILKQRLDSNFPRSLQLAIEYIQNHSKQEISLQHLSEASYTSVSKLNSLFKEHLYTSPMQYVKNIRLKAVHATLCNTPLSNIAEIALEHGFNHMGHFSRDYKLMFGETPKQTVKRFYKH
nr:AraC family transcriptional regulator [Acinetobacter sp. Marseille-Q1620]